MSGTRRPLLRDIVPRRLRRFPYTSPSWPSSLPREPDKSKLESNYDTDWARQPASKATRRLLQDVLMRPAVRVLARTTVEGLDRIEDLDDAPVIFTPNHHSHVDTAVLLDALPSRFRNKAVVAAAGDYFFDTRAKSVVSALALNAIPIERRKVSRASSDLALELLRDNWNLIIYPEGGRSPDGWGQDFKPGAAFLSIRGACPVVPVHIEGTGAILGKGMSRPHLGRVTVAFGLPLRPTTDEDPRDFSRRIEAAVAQLGDETNTDWWSARQRAARNTTPDPHGPDGIATWRRVWSQGAKPSGRKRPERSWP